MRSIAQTYFEIIVCVFVCSSIRRCEKGGLNFVCMLFLSSQLVLSIYIMLCRFSSIGMDQYKNLIIHKQKFCVLIRIGLLIIGNNIT